MSKEFTYLVDYDDEAFEEYLAEVGPEPLLNFRIEVDGEDIAGAPEGEAKMFDYIGMHIARLLGSVPKLRRGEDIQFKFYEQGWALVVEPQDGEVNLVAVTPSKLDDIPADAWYTVSRTAFVEGICRAAEEFVDQVVAVDPSLADHDRIQDIEQRVAEIRENG